MKKYREEFQTLVKDQTVISDCNAITFLNTGSTNIVVNGLTLAPGDQYVSQFNEGEENVTRYNVQLNTGQAMLIRKTEAEK